MPKKTVVFTDTKRNLTTESTKIAPKSTDENWSVHKSTYRGGKQAGVESVEIDNGKLRFSILATRGMGLWKARSGDAELGWQSPVDGPVHPNFVPTSEPSGLGWLDGFDELLVRCGLVSNGAPDFDPESGRLLYPLHGKIGNLPAHYLEVTVDTDEEEISVTGIVDETRFHFHNLRMKSTITTKFGESSIHIHDEIENLSDSPAEIQMLYHFNFGTPLLDAGSKLVLPAKTIVPRNEHAASEIDNWANYSAPQAGFEEQVYFFELIADDNGDTRVLLKNAHGTEGVSLDFNKKQIPWFTQWKNTTSIADGYVTGIEPGTNFPNPRTYEGEQGRVIKLGSQSSHTFDVSLNWHQSEAEVKKSEKAISRLQGKTKPKIFEKPEPGWCAP